MKLEKFLQNKYNYNPDVKNNIMDYIKLWNSWYVGNVRNFHNYYIYNGQAKVKTQRYSMSMAKTISEDWADILWSEKCKVSFKDETSQNEFDKKVVDELNLNSVINQTIEKSGAFGTCAVVTGVYDIVKNFDKMTLDVTNAKVRTDIVDAEWIFPLTWNNKSITECAFGSVEYNSGQKYIVLSVHKLNDVGNYVIYNHLFAETNGNLTEIELKDTEKIFDTKSNKKWFSIFKPSLTNNLFKNNPFGISYYANAIDSLKAVDLDFDALTNEVKDGKRRTFVRADMLNYDNGQQKMTFDPNDTNIYVLPTGATKDDLIQNDSTTLRTKEQIEALNTSLNILGTQCGFGENHYHFDGTNLSTATAVISSNSKMARRKKKLEIGYESSIYDLVMSICYALTEFGTSNINTDDLVINFDDSIIEDKESESIRALREVNVGIMSKVEYRMKIYGETEEIAEAKIQKIQENEPTAEEMIG